MAWLPRTATVAVVLLLLPLLVVRPSWAETHTDCGVAQTAFSFCVAYVAGLEHAVPPKCCMGIKDVQEELVPSSLGQRGVCECLKQELADAGAVDGARASSLSATCGVATYFLPTSLDFDCNGIS